MRRLRAIVAALPVVLGCQLMASNLRPPLETEGELYVYLQPFAAEARRLAFVVDAVAAVPMEGPPVPLRIARAGEFSGKAQVLVAWGRLPPGRYDGIDVTVRSATLDGMDGRAALLVPAEPVRAAGPFHVERRAASTLWLALKPGRSFDSAASFAPAFRVFEPPSLAPGRAAYATSPEAGTLTVIDRRTLEVATVYHLGGEPEGIAIASSTSRAFVALAAEDSVAVVDLATGVVLSRIPLRPGDRPREAVLTPDGRLLLVVNSGSSTVSFVDPAAEVELDRVPTGRDPTWLLLDHAGRRAFVCNRLSNSITVIDLPSRMVISTVATEPDPVAVALSRAEDRLYVAQAASPFLGVYSTATLAPLAGPRVLVGPGTTMVRVDPRTDFVYVGQRDRGEIQVLDPSLLLPLGGVAVPGGVSYAIIDDAENTLLAAMPARDGVVAVDLGARRTSGAADTAGPPLWVAVVGERR